MRVHIQVINPIRVKGAGPPDKAVDLIPFSQQKFGQVRAVLAGDAGDESFFHYERLRFSSQNARRSNRSKNVL